MSPIILILGELPALLYFWETCPTPENARNLLVAWAGLKRLIPNTNPNEDESKLNGIVQKNSELPLTACEGVIFDAENWIRQFNNLSSLPQEDQYDQLHYLFQKFDHANLVLWALSELIPKSLLDKPIPAIIVAQQELERVDRVLQFNCDLFLPITKSITEVINSSRSDLFEQYPTLWETLLYHRIIEEMYDDYMDTKTFGRDLSKKIIAFLKD